MSKVDKPSLEEIIRAKALRKIKANQTGAPGLWRGLGMMGLIGWSVAIPTLLGAGLGFWLDERFPGQISWTLTILLVGLIVGCANAWHWVQKEREEIEDEGNE